MLAWIHSFLSAKPLLVLFLTIVFGYLIGKFRVKTFVLGGIAGSLIIGVLLGQFDVSLPPSIGTVFFALFIYAVGYQGGPQFFRSLNRQTLVLLISATVTCLLGLGCVLIAAGVYHLDRGTAAGLAAGGLTQSAMIGTASAAIGKLALTGQQIKTMQSNVAVGYAVCYIFGSFGPILLLSALFPALMRWNLRKEAQELAKNLEGGKPVLDPGQYQAIPKFDTRVYEIQADCQAVGKTVAALFDSAYEVAVEALVRQGKRQTVTPETLLQVGDVIAVTAKVNDFMQPGWWFEKEVAKPDEMQLTEETRNIILTNRALDSRNLQQLYQQTAAKDHYGVFVNSVSRLGEEFAATPDFVLKRGDELSLTGRNKDLDRFSNQVGRVISNTKLTDFVTFGLGIVLGFLIGMITVHIGGVAISVGSGGGCLFSGLFVGWLRSRHPRIGALPTGASNFLRDFGLAVFVASVGITAGPQAVVSIKQHGLQLFLLGIGVTLIPQIITFYFSYYILRIKNPIVLLSTIAGGRSANPGFAALLEKAGNSTPVLPFTVTYALANIWLTLWGPIIVALVATNVH